MRRTKQKNTDWEQAEQKREAVKSVLISAGFRVGAAALLFCARGRTPWPRLITFDRKFTSFAGADHHTVQFGGTAAAAAGDRRGGTE